MPIKHAEEVEEVFDAISYCKGACVIRMLNAVLGEEAFRKGLQVYMKVRFSPDKAWQNKLTRPKIFSTSSLFLFIQYFLAPPIRQHRN